MLEAVVRYFRFSELKTGFRSEVIGGVTTFMAMAYIIFVNPAMISRAGMDFGSAMSATCVSAAIATLVMGIYARYPIALASGMGENAFFTYTVCLTLGIPWQTALGCVFIEGIFFIILTVTRMREYLFDSIPVSLRYSVACGIGLLIAFVGLNNAGLIVAHPATFVTLGDVLSPAPLLAMFGLLATGVLVVRRVRGAILLGILLTALAAVAFGMIKFQGVFSVPPSMAPTFLKMDIRGAFGMGVITVVMVFLFMDIFDTVGTLAGVGELGGFMKNGRMPRVGRAMLSDAIGTCVGAACGTPVVTSYVESAAGISSGGRSGFASVVTGLLFLAALFFSPLVKMIGGGYQPASGNILYPVTAPALIAVGCMMMQPVARIDWKDYSESIPAFLVILIMPLTFSIATGIAFGLISYAGIKLLSGRGKDVSWLVYLLAVIFILRFVYLKSL